MPENDPPSAPGSPPSDGLAESATRVPLFISAEAAVKSRRADYISLFDPTADLNAFKKCRSDADLMKQAVQQLKHLGFTVSGTGPCSIFFAGTRGLFQRTFAVTFSVALLPGGTRRLRARPSSGQGEPSGLFPVPDGPLAPLLAGCLVSQPAIPAWNERPPSKKDPDNDLYLEDLAPLLGQYQQRPIAPSREAVVVDTNFLPNHPCFKNKNIFCQEDLTMEKEPEGDWVEVEKFLENLKNIFAPKSKPPHRVLAHAGVTAMGINFPEKGFAALKEAGVELPFTKWAEITPENFRERLRAAHEALDKDDKYPKSKKRKHFLSKNHGTAVAANLLAIAPQAKLHLKCSEDLGSDFGSSHKLGADVFGYLMQHRNVVVNCSFSVMESDSRTEDFSTKMTWKFALNTADRFNNLVVIAAGNSSNTTPSIIANTNHPCALVVGAAFRMDKSPDLIASNLACAFPANQQEEIEAIPHVCGLSGGTGDSAQQPGAPVKGLIYAPGAEPDWDRGYGTSYAAPQITGLCLLVWAIWPGAAPADVKAILMETSAPVRRGFAYNPRTKKADYPLWNEDTGHKAGLVQIDDALVLAEFCSIWNAVAPTPASGNASAATTVTPSAPSTATQVIEALKAHRKDIKVWEATSGVRKLSLDHGDILLDYVSAVEVIITPLSQALTSSIAAPPLPITN